MWGPIRVIGHAVDGSQKSGQKSICEMNCDITPPSKPLQVLANGCFLFYVCQRVRGAWLFKDLQVMPTLTHDFL